MSTPLTFEAVGWSRGGRAVLRGVSFAAAAGRVTVLLGRPQDGGAAVLAIAAGLHAPDTGRVLLGGQPIGAVPPPQRGIVLVAPAARPGLFGRPRPAGQPDDPAPRIRGAGQARLLLAEPDGSGLPAAGQPGDLRDLLPAGPAVLLSTGVAATALCCADLLLVLRHGAVVQAGPPRDIYGRPASLHAARLTGEANCVPATVAALEEDGVRVRLATGEEMEAETDAALVPGQPCRVVVRPECLALVAADAQELGGIAATVLRADDLGEHVRVRLRLGCGTVVAARRPAVLGTGRLSAGTAVRIAWQAQHGRALAEAADDR